VSKRFIDTALWDHAWFRELSPKLKCVWMYLVTRSSPAGVWTIDLSTLKHFVGQSVTLDEIQSAFKVEPFGGDKLFIRGFIEFQYGTLSESCKPHQRVIRELNQYGIDPKTLRVPKGYPKGSETLEEEEEEEEEEKGFKKGGVGENKLPPLAELWNEAAAPQLPRVLSVNPGSIRGKSTAERWKERPDPAHWRQVIERINQSNFCTGNNGRGWIADFDFLIRPDTATKVLEGKYDNRGPGGTPAAPLDPKSRADIDEFEREMQRAREQLA
jgi:hypothetical protein